MPPNDHDVAWLLIELIVGVGVLAILAPLADWLKTNWENLKWKIRNR